MPSLFAAGIQTLMQVPPLQLLAIGLASYIAIGYLRRKWITRKMPP